MPLFVDEFEPESIYMLLEQCCPVQSSMLNRSGMADYVWIDVQGNTRQIERKQSGELLSDLDSVEMQLRREIPNADCTDLLIEGIMKSTQYGIDAYQWTDGDRKHKAGYKYTHSFGDKRHPQAGLSQKLWAWVWVLEKMGVSTWFTNSYSDTARAVAAFYNSSMKEEHATLNRYLKPKQPLRTLDHHVLSLMGLEGANLGQVRAEALINQFGSVWGVLSADEKDLELTPHMGKRTTDVLLRSIGRKE